VAIHAYCQTDHGRSNFDVISIGVVQHVIMLSWLRARSMEDIVAIGTGNDKQCYEIHFPSMVQDVIYFQKLPLLTVSAHSLSLRMTA
jgi:hypothetical protein